MHGPRTNRGSPSSVSFPDARDGRVRMVRSISQASAPRMAAVAALTATVALVVLLGALPASAAAGTVKEFKIPGQGTGAEGIAVGPDGAIWFTQLTTSSVGRLGRDG